MKTLTEKFTALTNAAFTAVKKKLADLGGIMFLVNPITLHIDNDTGFIYNLDARAIALRNGNLVILSTGLLESGFFKKVLDNPNSGDNFDPDDYWVEGSECYAEWENLLELFDQVLACDEARPLETVHREQLINLLLDGSVHYYLYDSNGDICEYDTENIFSARKAINKAIERHGGYYCESGVLVTDVPGV